MEYKEEKQMRRGKNEGSFDFVSIVLLFAAIPIYGLALIIDNPEGSWQRTVGWVVLVIGCIIWLAMLIGAYV